MSGLAFPALAAKVRAVLPEVTAEQSENGQPFLRAPAASLPALASLLRDDPALRFDALMDLSTRRSRRPMRSRSSTCCSAIRCGTA